MMLIFSEALEKVRETGYVKVYIIYIYSLIENMYMI